MQNINWDKFKQKTTKEGETYQKFFQWMCYLLICEELNQKQGIFQYYNHPYLENEPVNGIGWQAKFYASNTLESGQSMKIIEDIKKAKELYPDLKKYILFISNDLGNNKGGKAQPQIDIEKCANELHLELDIRTNEKYFKSPEVANQYEYIIKYFFNQGNVGKVGLVRKFNSITQTKLKNINTSIEFNNQNIKIDNSKAISEINNKLNTNSLVLAGDGGVGKTALIKEIYPEYFEQGIPFFVFRALEFNVNTEDQFFSQFENHTDFTLDNFQAIFKQYDKKIIVIDSAERLGEVGNNYEIFSSILRSLKDNNWTLIFTTRTIYFEQLQYKLNSANLAFKEQRIPKLENLVEIASNYKFKLPDNNRLKNILTYPFYLNEYLQNYTQLGNIKSLKQFKENIWNIRVLGLSENRTVQLERESCFKQIIEDKIETGKYVVNCHKYNKIGIAGLETDGIISQKDKSSWYFITHDIYEEWGLEKKIQDSFVANEYDYNQFYLDIEDSLSIRKAFANWLYEGLYGEESDKYYNLLTNSFKDSQIRKIWKDEIILALLKSNFASDFIEKNQDLITENNFELFKRFLFILRLGCKELDQDLVNKNDSKNNYFANFFYKPIDYGNGWQAVINFIFQNINKFEVNEYKIILPVLWDWNYRNKSGETTKQAGLVALHLYGLILENEYYSFKDQKTKLFEVITNANSEIKEKLSKLIDQIITKEKSHHGLDFDFTAFLLSDTMNTQEVCKHLPEKIIELAQAYWFEESKEREWFGSSSMDIDENYGISTKFRYYPASPFNTPIYHLLSTSHIKVIQFIITFINKTTSKYVEGKSSKKYKVHINEKHIEQYGGETLYNAYRGVTTQQSDLVTSILMALEKWLIEVDTVLPYEVIEKICINLIEKANSVSITAVIASLVLANPDKHFNLAKILFQTKELFLYDKSRVLNENTEGFSRNLAWSNIEYHDHFKKFDNLPHRQWDLEFLAIYYQQFRTPNITDQQAQKQKEELHTILDNYQSEIKDNPENIRWRFALSRIDIRNSEIKVTEHDEKTLLISYENNEIDEELQYAQEKAQAMLQESNKYTELFLFSTKKKNNETLDQKYQYENNPQKTFEDLKKIDTEIISLDSEDWKKFKYIKTLCDTSYVLLRDHNKDLQKDQLEDLVEIVLKSIKGISNPNWQYQIDSGYESSILALVEIYSIFPESKTDAEFILFFLLLSQENEIIYSIIKAILELNKIDEKASLKITKAYLEFKPIWEKVKKEDRLKNIPQGSMLVEKLMQYQFEADGKLTNIFIEQKESEIRQFFENDNTFSFENLDKLELYHFYRLFAIIPSNTKNPEYLELAKKMIERLPKIIYEDTDYTIRQKFIWKLVDFILNRETTEVETYIKPLLENFVINRKTEDLIEAFITHTNKEKNTDNFWKVWEYFYPKVVTEIKNNYNGYSDEVLKGYLFCSGILNEYDNKWSITQKRLLEKLNKDLPESSMVLYCLAKLGSTVYRDLVDKDFIIWLNNLISKIQENKTELEQNTVYYLEKVVVNYYHQNTKELKHNKEPRDNFIEILNFLIEEGSIQGFRLRDEI